MVLAESVRSSHLYLRQYLYKTNCRYVTYCVSLVADLLLFCYERVSEVTQSEVIEAFHSTSRYLDGLLSIDNSFFDRMVNRSYPSELQLNKANISDTGY